jgi:hypothetical protein
MSKQIYIKDDAAKKSLGSARQWLAGPRALKIVGSILFACGVLAWIEFSIVAVLVGGYLGMQLPLATLTYVLPHVGALFFLPQVGALLFCTGATIDAIRKH